MQRTTSNESGTSSNVTDITSRVGSLLGSLRNNEGLNLHRTQSNQSSQENSGNIYGVLCRGLLYIDCRTLDCVIWLLVGTHLCSEFGLGFDHMRVQQVHKNLRPKSVAL